MFLFVTFFFSYNLCLLLVTTSAAYTLAAATAATAAATAAEEVTCTMLFLSAFFWTDHGRRTHVFFSGCSLSEQTFPPSVVVFDAK